MMPIGVLLRTYFSLHHVQAAAFHARQAAGVELDGSEEAGIALSAHVAAAVISAGAFLEATGNEITGNDERPRRSVRGQPAALLRLNEYLEANGVTVFTHGDARWESAKTLLDLRNRLVHYSHDWLDSGTEEMMGDKALTRSDLLPRMKREFQFLSPRIPNVPWFLSPDCAAWAVDTAIAFLDEFFLRLGTQPFYDHLRHRIEVSRLHYAN